MKRVYITGASRGIGRAIAHTLGREGYAIAFSYHTATQEAQSLVTSLQGEGIEVHAIQADLSTPEGGMSASVQALEKLGGMDAIVCNCGLAYQGLLQEMSPQDWQQVMNTNLDAVFYTVQPLLSTLITQQQGNIVTLSSMWGQVGASCEVAYSAAKGGVIAFTKALALELAPSGIRVNCVAPGVIQTDMLSKLTEEDIICLKEETPLGRLGSPEEVAQSVAFLLSEKATFLTGQVLAPNGGLVM